MRWALAILVSLNAVLFLWIQFGPARQGQELGSREVLPDFGDIRLLEEVTSAEEKPAGEGEAPPPAEVAVQEESTDISSAPVEEEAPASVPVDREAPAISDPPVSTAVSVAEEPPPSLPPVEYCGEFGPFPSRNMAEGFRRKLAMAPNAEVAIESRKGKVDVGYWVMIPPLASVEDAEAMYKKLREAGFEDLWLMRKGEHAKGISMGLYTEERYARRHGNNIRKKGFETVIVPKQKNARLFWVVFSGVSQNVLEALEKGKLPQGAALRKKTCARGSASN